ncbi:Polysaccharide export protein, partial [Candidatus Magnetomorum sp. HK-1]
MCLLDHYLLKQSKIYFRYIIALIFCLLIYACTSQNGPVVTIKSIETGLSKVIAPEYQKKIDELKRNASAKSKDNQLDQVIESTHNMLVTDYLKLHPENMNRDKIDYKIGGYDVLSITVYEEADLSRNHVRVAADGFISFPLIGRVKVENLNTSEIEQLLTQKLMEGQFL